MEWLRTGGKAKCVLTGSEGWRHGSTSAGDGCEAGTWAEAAAEAWIILAREGNVNEGERRDTLATAKN